MISVSHRRRLTSAAISALIFITTVVGCDPLGLKKLKDESAKWRKQSEDWQEKFDNAQTRLNDQSEEWQAKVDNLGKAMVVATDKLDPLNLKEIYRDNKDLNKIIEELKRKIAKAEAAEGDLLLGDRRIFFEIIDVRGNAVVTATIDDQPNLLTKIDIRAKTAPRRQPRPREFLHRGGEGSDSPTVLGDY